MKRLFGIVMSGALGVMLLQAPMRAQSRTVSGEMKVVTGTVEKIDLTARILTIKTATDYEEISVPATVKNFSNVTVGDKLTLRYYNVVQILKKPGEAAVDRRTETVTPGIAGTSGTLAKQRTITATITAIDEQAPSVSFKGPRGGTFTSPVRDRAALSKVKIGDQVEITWTDAVLVSLEPAAN
jgi:Cu/Ag efflux protein CusF